MERVPLLGVLGGAALYTSRRFFVGSRRQATRWGLGALVDTTTASAISHSTLDLVARRRATAVGRNPRRRRERETPTRETGGITRAARREAASRERGERGDGDDNRIWRRSNRTAPPPPSPLLEAPVLATEEHADNFVVVVAAVGHRAETGSGERPSRPSPPPSWTPPHGERGEQRQEREEKVAAAAAGKGEEGGGTGAREIEREREGEDDDGAERRE
uniref:Uncharacterized protein n=1 Tax=Oryza rufipogon TaxID=4529 RepID=A0A0E0PLI5_ORYRU